MENNEMENETPENNEEEISEENEEDGGVAKANEVAKNQKIRAEKAEKELKKLKAKKEKSDSKTSKNEEQPDEPDYALDAFLEGRGIKTPDDNKLIKDEMARLKLPASDILGMKHIQAKLKDAKDQREAEDGMPEGGKGGKSSGSKSVDYYVNKKNKDGTYVSPPPELGFEFANKVIDARLKGEKNSKMFDDNLN